MVILLADRRLTVVMLMHYFQSSFEFVVAVPADGADGLWPHQTLQEGQASIRNIEYHAW